MARDKLGRFMKGSIPHNKGKHSVDRKTRCRKCGGDISYSASYTSTTGLCRECYLEDLHRNRKGRTPNTKCEICGKPLYRRPWQLRERSFFHCANCRSEAIKCHPHVYKRIAHENFGNRFKKGRKLTIKQKRETSIRMKGRTPWNKGLTRADDGRITAPWEGKKRPSPSIETQRKRRRSMATVFRSRPTNIEKELYSFLAVQKIKFDKQQPINGKFIVDAYVPSHKLVIEADGEYWHSREPNIKRDKSENAYLRKCGYNVIRLKEVEILDGSFRAKLKEVLNADI